MELDSTLPTSVFIEQARIKLREGTLTQDEAKEIVRVLRNGRMNAAATSKSSTKKAKVEVDAQGLLDDLEKL